MQRQLTQLRDAGLVAREIIAADNPWQWGGLLTQTGEQAFGRIAFTGLFVLAIAVAHCFHLQGHDPVGARFDQGG
jgi:hypothetical protein